MKFICTLEVLNRRAIAHGESGRVKTCKVVVQLKNILDEKPLVWISSQKDIEAQKYLIENIGTIRKNFIHEGKITIEMREPEINLMFRGATQEDLKTFLEGIESLKVRNINKNKAKPSVEEVPKPSEKHSLYSGNVGKVQKSSLQSQPGSLVFPGTFSKTVPKFQDRRPKMSNTLANFIIRGNSPSGPNLTGLSTERKRHNDELKDSQPRQHQTVSVDKLTRLEKRHMDKILQRGQFLPPEPPRQDKKIRFADNTERAPYFPEEGFKVNLDRDEMVAIRRDLKTNKKKLTVIRRKDYPLKGFSIELEHLTMNEISLSKIDSRLLDLKNLQTLNLTGNQITSIECLKGMDSRLNKLILDKNCIERISEDFFSCRAMKWLTMLSFAENKLVNIPRSIVKLENLQLMTLSRNNLRFLPYNIHLMRNLGKLFLGDNRLTFLPFPITFLRLIRLDISNNNFPTISVKTATATVQLDEFPTLFELAAGCIQTHNYKNRNYKNKILNVTPVDVPKVVYDILEACKFCLNCGCMVARYNIDIVLRANGTLAEEIVGQQGVQNVPTKKVFCQNCSRDS